MEVLDTIMCQTIILPASVTSFLAACVISKVWLCLNCLILGQNVKMDELLCKGEMPFGIIRNSR